jgi:hypothetical protein
MTSNYASYGAMRLKKSERECVSRSYDIGMNLAKPKYSFDLKDFRREICSHALYSPFFLTELRCKVSNIQTCFKPKKVRP